MSDTPVEPEPVDPEPEAPESAPEPDVDGNDGDEPVEDGEPEEG